MIPDSFTFLAGYPGFLPGLVVTLIVASGLFRPVARAVSIEPWLAFAILASLGLIVSATLFPDVLGLGQGEPGTAGPFTCDTERWRPSLSELVDFGESTANVVLFGPLGLFTALLPSRQRGRAVRWSLALPFLIEATQLILPPLNRACQTADIADNVTGLVVGLGIGWVVDRALRAARPSSLLDR